MPLRGDDPGDPPPGQEQPPDGRRLVAASGRAGCRRAGRDALDESVRRVGTIALVHETLESRLRRDHGFRRSRPSQSPGRGRGRDDDRAGDRLPRSAGAYGRMRAEGRDGARAHPVGADPERGRARALPRRGARSGSRGTATPTPTVMCSGCRSRMTGPACQRLPAQPAGLGTQIVISLVQDLRGRSGGGGCPATVRGCGLDPAASVDARTSRRSRSATMTEGGHAPAPGQPSGVLLIVRWTGQVRRR